MNGCGGLRRQRNRRDQLRDGGLLALDQAITSGCPPSSTICAASSSWASSPALPSSTVRPVKVTVVETGVAARNRRRHVRARAAGC